MYNIFYEYDKEELREIKRKLSEIKIKKIASPPKQEQRLINYRDIEEEEKKLDIYVSNDLIELDIKALYNYFIKTIQDIKRSILYHNYSLISLEEVDDIEYNFNLIKNSFTPEKYYLLDEFYYTLMWCLYEN